DAGIDLVAYSPDKKRSFTIQVKANLAPKPGGGKGAPAIDWWVDEDCPAEWIVFADVSTRRLWMMSRQELAAFEWQTPSIYVYGPGFRGLSAPRQCALFGISLREPCLHALQWQFASKYPEFDSCPGLQKIPRFALISFDSSCRSRANIQTTLLSTRADPWCDQNAVPFSRSWQVNRWNRSHIRR